MQLFISIYMFFQFSQIFYINVNLRYLRILFIDLISSWITEYYYSHYLGDRHFAVGSSAGLLGTVIYYEFI